MTLSETRLTEISANTLGTLNKLNSWGTPAVGQGPRPRVRQQVKFTDEVSKTQQSFKDECDINRIMAKYRKTGELTHLATRNPQYGDFTNATDYLEASNRVIAAQADFDSLSGEIRARMENSPAKFLDFMENPDNEAEARELGLLPALDPGTQAQPPAGGETPPLDAEGNTPIAGGE